MKQVTRFGIRRRVTTLPNREQHFLKASDPVFHHQIPPNPNLSTLYCLTNNSKHYHQVFLTIYILQTNSRLTPDHNIRLRINTSTRQPDCPPW
jgi:hypothetical protein